MAHIFFAGGGSLGHIAPSVAIAEELQRTHPSVNTSFVCGTWNEERKYIEQHGFRATPISAPRISPTFPWKFWAAYRHARALIRERQPNIVFSKGGYVSVPVCLAAHHMGIPIILHESDAVGGLANRLVARWATTICSGFAPAKNEPRIQFTGNPVSASITRGEKERGFALTGFSGTRPILLILGGSQGSLAINEAVVAHLGDLLTLCDIIHITGEGKRIIQGTRHGYWQIPFAFEELPDLYAIANLALSRAGASTLAELAANGIPAILVPLRGVAHDHQEKNARRAEQTGGCVVLEQEDLPSTLVGTVRSLLPSDVRRKMGESLRTLHAPDAARQIVEVIARSLV